MATTCIMPNDGTGTAQLPPFLCSYETGDDIFMIIHGLPPGTTIEMNGLISDFTSLPPFEVPGGVLGGKTHQFEALLHLDVLGTGDLNGFTRQITLFIFGEIHTAPRTPGDPIQIFQQEFKALQGNLYGDPDFADLTITAGAFFGLPSPGQGAMTLLPNGSFAIDSFFDLFYRIDFHGAPGGALEGLGGITDAHVRIQTGLGPVPDVVGKNESDATTDLTTSSLLKGDVACAYSNTVLQGNVISSLPVASTIVTAGSRVDLLISSGDGDVNGDDIADLKDVILGLMVLAGKNTAGLVRADYATSCADVNGDYILNMAEVVYGLQKIAGLL